VAAAAITLNIPSGGSLSATTDATGHFAFTSLPDATFNVVLTAPGYVQHRSFLALTGTRSAAVLDLIRDGGSFSLTFYRQFVRNGFESSTLERTRRWTVAPSFYLRTVTDDTQEPVPEEIISGIKRVIMNSVPELSAGQFVVNAFETGTEARPQKDGWVSILLLRNRSLGEGISGRSTVGGNTGTISIVYDPNLPPGVYNAQQCEAEAVSVADHEIVHTMGFYHTANTYQDFHSGQGCPGLGRPANTLYHAAVMYSRPPGNLDPDTDVTVLYSLGFSRAPQKTVACRLPDR
jgi:hypothetical protein